MCYTHGMGKSAAIKVIIALFIVALCWFGLAGPVFAADYEIQDVMNGNVSGIATLVKGAGGYYGNCISVTFSNNTGQTYSVRVPIGLQLIPDDSGVQTMLTAGGETLTVPPGQSSYPIKAFCGEMHDHAPSGYNTFTAGGIVSGDTLQTLQEINRQQAFNLTGQEAVWHQTDGNDISNNESAQQLVSGGGASPEAAAAAGGATAAAALGAAVLIHILNGGSGGSSGTTELDSPDGNLPVDDLPPDDDLITPFDEPVYDDEVFEDYQPPEDPTKFQDVHIDRSTDQLPPELLPPIEIAEIPPPEDPGDGIQVAGGDLEWLWQKFLEGRRMQVQVPENLPDHMKPDKGESAWDWFWRHLRNAPAPENDPKAREGGQFIRENAPFGSASPIPPALGAGDREFLTQIKREWHEIGGSEGIAKLRRFEKWRSLLNSRSGGGGTTRDISGITEHIRDWVEPDVKTWVHENIPVYQYDSAGHEAMEQFYERHGSMPDENDPKQLEEFTRLVKHFRRQQ